MDWLAERGERIEEY